MPSPTSGKMSQSRLVELREGGKVERGDWRQLGSWVGKGQSRTAAGRGFIAHNNKFLSLNKTLILLPSAMNYGLT
jgi:hypothetical protein